MRPKLLGLERAVIRETLMSKQFTDAEKRTIAAAATTAAHAYLYRHSVTMIDTGGEDLPLSSGTLVDAFGHLLVATAAHTIPPDPGGRLWILPKRPRKPTEGMLGFTRIKRRADLDIGLLEIDRESAVDYLGSISPCSVDQIKILGPARPRSLMSLIGSPVGFVKKGTREDLPEFVPQVVAFSTVAFSPDEWPTPPETEPNADLTRDIFFPLPEDDLVKLESNEPIKITTAKGFSGGGIWDLDVKGDELWHPERASLFGIEFAWSETQRYVRGTQIIHWLRLVRDEYPDIAQKLMERFPELQK
jgi:hypothetical protein